MTEGLRATAAELDDAGSRLAMLGGRLCGLDPGSSPFGVDGAGRLGELGRALHGLWRAALDTGARQAAEHGARLIATGDALRLAAGRYAQADDAAARQMDGPLAGWRPEGGYATGTRPEGRHAAGPRAEGGP